MPVHKKLSEYPDEWNAAKPFLEKLRVDISDHSYQKITKSVIENADVARVPFLSHLSATYQWIIVNLTKFNYHT